MQLSRLLVSSLPLSTSERWLLIDFITHRSHGDSVDVAIERLARSQVGLPHNASVLRLRDGQLSKLQQCKADIRDLLDRVSTADDNQDLDF